MKLNMPLISNIYRLRHENDWYSKEQYCFPLKRFLGENGLYENHELKGKTFRRKEDGMIFTVDNVYVHWYMGWYYMALARNSENSHGQISWNINSTFDISNIDCYELID